MKCHYTYDLKAGKVLIPYCWSVVHSNNMRLCTCRDSIDITFKQFKKNEYNKVLAKKNIEISELEQYVYRLNRILKKRFKNKHNEKNNTKLLSFKKP